MPTHLTIKPFMRCSIKPNTCSTLALVFDFSRLFAFCSSVNGLFRYSFSCTLICHFVKVGPWPVNLTHVPFCGGDNWNDKPSHLFEWFGLHGLFEHINLIGASFWVGGIGANFPYAFFPDNISYQKVIPFAGVGLNYTINWPGLKSKGTFVMRPTIRLWFNCKF